MTTQPTVTGVDFGSNQVKIAAILKGGVEVITNQANFRQTPNVIGYGNKERLIGEAGQVKVKSNHSNTVIAPNRYLGFNANNQFTQQQLKFCPAKAKSTQQKDSPLRFNLLQGQERQSFTPEQLVATFLTEIQKIITQTNNLSNKNMVITVPSFYSQHQRQALLNAVKIAQKKMKPQYSTQIVSEQIAASMDFGFGKRHQFQKDKNKAKNVLFVDFGHSKCNLFVTAFSNDHMKVIANKFNRRLGCKNLDEILLQFYANLFDSRNSSAQMNLMENKKSVLKLLQSIQRQRKVLSGVHEHDLNIECILEDYDLAYTMKRQEFQKICEPVVQKFKVLLQEFLTELKQQNIEINHIELIGGGSRIPIIIKSIFEIFGVEPSRTLNSNECIARGAALISAMNSSIFKTHTYNYIEASPYTFNISLSNENNKLTSLIQKGQFVPRQKQIQLNNAQQVGKVQFFVEYENLQQGIQTKVLSFQVTLKENKQEKKQNQMKDQSEQNQISNNTLKFVFQFDQNGLVDIKKAFQNGKELKIHHIKRYEKLTLIELNQFQAKQKQMALNDLKFKKLYEKKNEFQATVYSVRDEVEKTLNSQELKDFVHQNISKEAKQLIQESQKWIQAYQCQKVQEFQKKTSQIKAKSKQIIETVKRIKQRYTSFLKELQAFGNWLSKTINERSQVPQEVNQVGERFNQVMKKFNEQPKYQIPPISNQQLKQAATNVQLKLKEFDAQNQRRHRQNYQNNYARQQPSSTFRPQQSSFNPFGRSQFQPRSTRNTTRNNNSFGRGFFDGGFSSFF